MDVQCEIDKLSNVEPNKSIGLEDTVSALQDRPKRNWVKVVEAAQPGCPGKYL